MINLTELLDRAKKKALEKPDTKDGYAPKSTDELRFKKKHVVQKTDDRNGNKDDVFNATNVKSSERSKERHGYNVGDDEKVYEGYEEIRFDDPENNSKSSDSSKPKRNRSKRIDDMMNKLGNEYGQKNLASKIKQRYSANPPLLPVTIKNSHEPEGEELDEARRKKSPTEKLFNRLKNYGVKDPSAKPLVGNQHKIDANKNGKIDADDFKMLRKEEAQVDEVLKPSMGVGAYISDFVHSKNPKFAGKTKKERTKQALAAFLAAERGE